MIIYKLTADDLAAYVYLATGGLLLFRSGDVPRGRKLYEAAEAKAPKNRKLDVMLFRAREEEVRLGTTGSDKWLEKALGFEIPKDSLFLSKFQKTLKIEMDRQKPDFYFADNPEISKSLLDEVNSACKGLTLL